jgi:hypothetical protein
MHGCICKIKNMLKFMYRLEQILRNNRLIKEGRKSLTSDLNHTDVEINHGMSAIFKY